MGRTWRSPHQIEQWIAQDAALDQATLTYACKTHVQSSYTFHRWRVELKDASWFSVADVNSTEKKPST